MTETTASVVTLCPHPATLELITGWAKAMLVPLAPGPIEVIAEIVIPPAQPGDILHFMEITAEDIYYSNLPPSAEIRAPPWEKPALEPSAVRFEGRLLKRRCTSVEVVRVCALTDPQIADCGIAGQGRITALCEYWLEAHAGSEITTAWAWLIGLKEISDG